MAFSVNDVVVLSDFSDPDNWADSPDDDITTQIVSLLAGLSQGDAVTLSEDEHQARKEALGRLGRYDGSDANAKAFVFCGTSEVSRKTPSGTFDRTCITLKPIGGDSSQAINLCFAGSTIYTREARYCSRFVKIGTVGSLNQDLVNAAAGATVAPVQGLKLKVGGTAFDAGEHGVLDASGEVVPGDATAQSDFLCLVDMSASSENSLFINLRHPGYFSIATTALPSVSVGDTLYQAAAGGLATSGTVALMEVTATDANTTFLKVLAD